MTITLTLDAPGACEALARCYTPLHQWARQPEAQQTAASEDLPGDAPAAVPDPAPKRDGNTFPLYHNDGQDTS